MKVQSTRKPSMVPLHNLSVFSKNVCISMLVMICSLINLVFLCKVTWGVIQRSWGQCACVSLRGCVCGCGLETEREGERPGPHVGAEPWGSCQNKASYLCYHTQQQKRSPWSPRRSVGYGPTLCRHSIIEYRLWNILYVYGRLKACRNSRPRFHIWKSIQNVFKIDINSKSWNADLSHCQRWDQTCCY